MPYFYRSRLSSCRSTSLAPWLRSNRHDHLYFWHFPTLPGVDTTSQISTGFRRQRRQFEPSAKSLRFLQVPHSQVLRDLYQLPALYCPVFLRGPVWVPLGVPNSRNMPVRLDTDSYHGRSTRAFERALTYSQRKMEQLHQQYLEQN